MNQRCTTAILSILMGSVSFAIQAQDTPSSEPAPAEEVIVQVKGGDLIHGKLIGENDDSVVVVSPVLGTITLPRDQVETVVKNTPDAAAIASAKAEEVSLSSVIIGSLGSSYFISSPITFSFSC